ncbi:MAG: hypothetical protein SFY32_00185 [Bacteroidota bacterium]|nr:hypothetical protein [Bacteroidota bacterium]
MFKYILSILILTGFNMSFAQEKIRPKENWVMRSVLDKRARTITVFLNKDIQIAYDGNNCGVYKIWKDGVINKGTIWNNQHGPQPISNGKEFTYGIVDEQVWFLQKLGVYVPAKVQFRGYIWKNNKVTFKYEISPEDKSYSIFVEETPEYVIRPSDNFIGIERTFKVTGLPAGQNIVTTLKYNNLAKKEDLITNGNFTISSKTENFDSKGNTIDIKGNLLLKNEQAATVSCFFNPKIAQ